ncbi:DUF3429 domain-containing protein [Marinobacter zhanjiangensis]|uniref:Membrane protein n=1 Tax=Marinobacter zhanjiangensis TaxID=578215 RepID=A0ABQ3AKP7_9GAMM|nr:DUF3429 domain-containing protein [Marinobacter zhanjiangensis]GGY60216.1 membrane protein [Marinobacter zhanjiangensis]
MIAVQRLAMLVGLAGLIPFLIGAFGLFLMPAHDAWLIKWFYIYSAGILAFMSGVYWPVAMQLENRCYPLSPVVTLVISQVLFLAGGLTLLLPMGWRAVIYPVLYLAVCLIDVRWLYNYWPRWYRKLRTGLTAVVVACQLMVLAWMVMN